MLSKFIAVVSLLVLSFALSILVMKYDWGLNVESWWWVIGGGIVGRMLVEVMVKVTRGEK